MGFSRHARAGQGALREPGGRGDSGSILRLVPRRFPRTGARGSRVRRSELGYGLNQVRVLFDQGTPVPLRDHLRGHEVITAFEAEWSDLSNGELLDRADAQFDVFVTTDQQLRYQQNLDRRTIAILVLPYANWIKLQPHAATIAASASSLRAGDYVELDLK